MNVETYEIEEIKGELGVMAADSESIELIEKLGLNGQKALSEKTTDTRFPYPRLSAREELVYGTLLPEKTEVAQYRSGIIPLRVLQVIAHVREFGFIKRIEVWHPTDAREKDPVLIAVEKNANYEWMDGPLYVLARWGDSLQSLDELAIKACKIWVSKTRTKLLGFAQQIQSELQNLEATGESSFLSGKEKRYSFDARS